MSKETEKRFELSDAFVRDLFLKIIDDEAVGYLEKDQKVEYFFERDTINLLFRKAGRVVCIETFYDKKAYEQNACPDTITVSFHFDKGNLYYFSIKVKELLTGSVNTVYHETGEALGSETLSFLRYLKKWAEIVKPNCKIKLRPVSVRRAELYSLATRHLENVEVLMENLYEDKKKLNSGELNISAD